MSIDTNRLLSIAVVTLWLLIIGTGIQTLLTSKNAPAQFASASVNWPETSLVQLAPGRPTLIVVMHPQCSCTRPTIRELDRLTTQIGDRLKVYVLIIKPKGAAENWEKTDLWYDAAAISGVTVVTDQFGTESHRLNATISGETFLYSENGRLLYKGGISGVPGYKNSDQDQAACCPARLLRRRDAR